jgi:hypothetical protein
MYDFDWVLLAELLDVQEVLFLEFLELPFVLLDEEGLVLDCFPSKWRLLEGFVEVAVAEVFGVGAAHGGGQLVGINFLKEFFLVRASWVIGADSRS